MDAGLRSSIAKLYIAGSAVIAWTGVLLQFYVTVFVLSVPDQLSTFESVIKYLTFFTIWGNTMVALCLSAAWLPWPKMQTYFRQTRVQTAAAVYIIIVAVAYSLLLRQLWHPQGSAYVADELLHDVTPTLYLLYWTFLRPPGAIAWKNIFIWLGFPAIYFIWALVRGALMDAYPYFFLNVGKYGYPQVLLNAVVLLLGFVVVGALLLVVNSRFPKPQ